VIADLEGRSERLRAAAPGPVEAGWADFYRGVIADNLRALDVAEGRRHLLKVLAGDAVRKISDVQLVAHLTMLLT